MRHTALIYCARCKKRTGATIQKLWNGPNGLRRYDVCDKCAREICAEESHAKAEPAPAVVPEEKIWS